MTPPDIAAIARGLSEAQKLWLTERAVFKKPRPYSEARWMTFPPANTLKSLYARGLVKPWGSLTDRGLSVRDHLLSGKQA